MTMICVCIRVFVLVSLSLSALIRISRSIVQNYKHEILHVNITHYCALVRPQVFILRRNRTKQPNTVTCNNNLKSQVVLLNELIVKQNKTMRRFDIVTIVSFRAGAMVGTLSIV